MMELTPIHNDASVQDLLELILCGEQIEAVSLDLTESGPASSIILHFESGRDVILAASEGCLCWAEDGIPLA